MKKVLLVANTLSALPFLVAFLLVTSLAFLIGKIPWRGDKLKLLPWLDFLCDCLTVGVALGLLRAVGLPSPIAITIVGIAWLFFYLQRVKRLTELGRALAGFLVGFALYQL